MEFQKTMKGRKGRMEYQPYLRTAFYYETDQMGIVHHSNYIRWLEEARMDWMEQLGIDYKQMEEKGILIPVLSVQCTYRLLTKYHETVMIVPKLEKLSAVKFKISYRILNPDTGEIHNTASTEHCFLNREFKPVFLKKEYPDIYNLFKQYEGVDLL